ncbi:dipeptidase [Halioxenophilus aromaticivorans]|uniref:Dipeptidase n=1 Tax=Halioxenophilus aromaticivorans TaxID=1306992 RepID=A0AAV3U0Q2_9ALTE
MTRSFAPSSEPSLKHRAHHLLVPFFAIAALVLAGCAWQGPNTDSFKAYLAQQSKSLPRSEKKAIKRFLADESLTPEQQNVVQHQLGRYSVAKYGDEAMATLEQWVAIPTYRQDGVPQHENPEFKKMAAAIQAKAEAFGLAFRNIDDRVYEITLPGATDELIGVHAHADVVPVNPANWVLDNGTKLDPFKVTKIGNKMYGRGTEDDKNGIVVTLYGMRVILEENLPLQRTFKLLVDTTEETSGGAIAYYFERNPTPEYNLAMDGGYPVVIAEKGYGVVMTEFPVRSGQGLGLEFVGLTGGLASNQIPKVATALVNSPDLENSAAMLRGAAQQFVLEHGGNFSIDVTEQNEQLLITVTGVSAHSSDPASGVNPVARLLLFIDLINQRGGAQQNHITAAAHYAAQNWGLNFYAEKLGVDFSHPFMGPLTSAITLVNLNHERLQLAVNLRVPEGKPTAQLKQEIEQKLQDWKRSTRVNFDLDITIAEPMYRNPKGAWVNALLDVASANLGLPREFAASSGATSVHNLPNGVQFGLSMPGVKYTGHNANEFKTVDQFLLDLQVVTEMLVKVGQLPELN